MKDKAIVSVQIGEACQSEWERMFRQSWEGYAAKHGYDIVVIPDFIDPSANARQRSPNWQKLLICRDPRVAQYRSVVWLDSDVLVNYHTAPCIVSQWSGEKIGIVSERESLCNVLGANETLYERYRSFLGPYRHMEERYELSGLPNDAGDYSNTGVFVIEPARHAEILEYIYANYQETPHTAKEETPFSYHIYKHGLAERIDPRFNRLWCYEMIRNYPVCIWPSIRKTIEGRTMLGLCVNMAWHNAWFTHFTGETLDDSAEGSYRVRDDAALVFTELHDIMKIRLR